MKFTKYFLVAAMGLGLFACTNELDEATGDNGGQVQEKTAKAVLSLDFGKIGTRAVTDPTAGTDGTVAGTSTEDEIKSIYVILTPGTGTPQIEGGAVTGLGNDYTAPTATEETATYEFDTTIGEKEIYVVINPDVVPTETALNSKSAVTAYLTTLVDLKQDVTNRGTNGFMMTNQDGEAVKAIFLADETTEVNVTVERVVAKVTVTATALTNNQEEAVTISDLKYTFNNDRKTGFRTAKGNTDVTGDDKMRNANASATWNNITLGQQPSAVATPIYCLEDIETTRAAFDADDDDSEWNVTYLTFQAVYKPKKFLNQDLMTYTDNTEAVDHYFINQGKYINNYITAATFTALKTAGTLTDEDVYGPYTGGVHHFGPIWVGGTIGGTDEGEILRNHWYNYDITSFTFPGKPGKPDTGKKDGDPRVNLAISIADWTWSTQNVPL